MATASSPRLATPRSRAVCARVRRYSPRVRQRDTIVIGAGPGGLAAAAMLGRRGVDNVVVDRADAVGASWRRHYDRLHLHTVRWLSHLPGYRFSRRHGKR